MPSNQTKKKGRKPKHMKNMVCNPNIKGKTIKRNSCLTQSAMDVLKNSFNSSHPDKQIKQNDPKRIWKDLKQKLKTCNREDCWLNTVADNNLRNKLSKQLFAPYHPENWKTDKNAWLSNVDIANVLKQYETMYSNFKLIEPTPIDFNSKRYDDPDTCVSQDLCQFDLQELLDSGKTQLGMVFNLDKYGESGSHWVSMYVDLDNQYMFFMDSAGDTAPKQIKDLSKRIIDQGLELIHKKHIHYYENCPMEHQYHDNECGMYSIYFIVTMLTNKADKKTFKNYNEKIGYFKNKRIPDKFMHSYRKKYFNS